MKKSILEKISQVILIIFSVVLGLYLSERIEEAKNNKDAALLLSKIKSEVMNNKQMLENWTPYHVEIVRKLDSLYDNEEFISNYLSNESVLYEQVLTEGTFMGDMPSDDAWDIAKSHPLMVNIDYNDLLVLSKIYNQQEITYAPVSKLIELFSSANPSTREAASKKLLLFRNYIGEIAGREVQLLNYTKAAEEYWKGS